MVKRLTFCVFVFVFNLVSVCLNAKENEARDYWEEGIANFYEQDFIQSAHAFKKYLALEPDNAYAWYNLAIALDKTNDRDGMCEASGKAYELGYSKELEYFKSKCDKEYLLKILQKDYYRNEVLTAENEYRPVYSLKDSLQGHLRPERSCYDVTFYDLTVRIIPLGKKVQGNNIIHFTTTTETNLIQIDLVQNMQIDSIVYRGQDLQYERKFKAVFVHLPEVVPVGEQCRMQIYYQGKPQESLNPPWEGGFVWARDRLINHWVGVVCEGEGASLWWPTKDHLSDEPDSMQLNIEVPKAYTAVSNGTLEQQMIVDKKFRRFEWMVHYPINNYNATFYMGKYKKFTDSLEYNNEVLNCSYYVMPQNVKKAKKHFKQSLEILDVYSQLFGPFPFWEDGYRLVESPYEGMEHQTAIAYGNEYDASEVKWDYDNKSYDFIIVHETAHEWWGNSLTVGDMADAWMHESFATYAEFLFIESKDGAAEGLNEMFKHARYIYNFWPMVQNYNVNENAFASSDIYHKGAMMLHSLRSTINNDSLFLKILHDFNMQYRMQTVKTRDFIDFVNRYTGKDYSPFFKKYLYETRLPVLEYKYEVKENNIYFSCRWSQAGEGFFMPVTLLNDSNKPIRMDVTTEWQEVMLENTQTFFFITMDTDPALIPENGYAYFWTSNQNE